MIIIIIGLFKALQWVIASFALGTLAYLGIGRPVGRWMDQPRNRRR